MFERNVSPKEFDGLLKGTIPVFDDYGEYDNNGLAIVNKDGKRGVVNYEPRVVVQPEYTRIYIMKNGVIIAYDNGLYSLFDKDGCAISSRIFVSFDEAEGYGSFF